MRVRLDALRAVVEQDCREPARALVPSQDGTQSREVALGGESDIVHALRDALACERARADAERARADLAEQSAREAWQTMADLRRLLPPAEPKRPWWRRLRRD